MTTNEWRRYSHLDKTTAPPEDDVDAILTWCLPEWMIPGA